MIRDAAGEDLPTSWANGISTHLLHAELLRRQDEAPRPECGSGSAKADYNTPLHVFALFLILVLSTLACSFPILVRRVPQLTIPHRFLFLSRHFGTGVLIATAFVHLLPTAFTSLTDPCLPPFWNEGYPQMPGFIAMVSVLVVVGVEMFFATKGAGHSHGEYTAQGHESKHAGNQRSANAFSRPKSQHRDSYRRFLDNTSSEDLALEDATAWPQDGIRGNKGNKSYKSQRDDRADSDLDDLDARPETSQFLEANGSRASVDAYISDEDEEEAGTHSTSFAEQQQQQKMLLQCMLLEAGILFHSVFIGMAVSVATGTSFIVLLVAISFHQTFEGLALGSRISAITAFPRRSPKPWLMALAYGATTPIGQAIGLLVHNLYDPYSKIGLLMVGVMNSISSGLLLFAGLVELLAEDFLSDHSYETLQGQMRLQACASVLAGAFLMALVGAWA